MPKYDVYEKLESDEGIIVLLWTREQANPEVASNEVAMERRPREECEGCEAFAECWKV